MAVTLQRVIGREIRVSVQKEEIHRFKLEVLVTNLVKLVGILFLNNVSICYV